MARVTKNNFTRGVSGKVGGDMIFTQRNGKTYLGVVPERTAPFSEKQLAVQMRFKEASIYATNIFLDEQSKVEYTLAAQAQGRQPHIVASTDFLRAPEITKVDLTLYRGNVGDKIVIRAVDDFKVTRVTVAISNPDGTEVETGEAIVLINGLDWEYSAKIANPNYLGDKIKVTAMDKPGNKTSLEQTI